MELKRLSAEVEKRLFADKRAYIFLVYMKDGTTKEYTIRGLDEARRVRGKLLETNARFEMK